MSRRPTNRQTDNQRFRDAAKTVGLSKHEQERMHRDLQKDPDKDGKTYEELKATAQEYKSESPKEPNSNSDSDTTTSSTN